MRKRAHLAIIVATGVAIGALLAGTPARGRSRGARLQCR